MVDRIRISGPIAFEDRPTGDGTMLAAGAVRFEALPVPLVWDREEGDHSGQVVGAIESVTRDGDALIGHGYLSADSTDPATLEAVGRVAELFEEGAVGVSVRLDDVSSELRINRALLKEIDQPPAEAADGETDEAGRVVIARFNADDELEVVTDARLRHVAVLDTPAHDQARMRVDATDTDDTDETPSVAVAAAGTLTLGTYEGRTDAGADPDFGLPGQDQRLLYDPERDRWSCPPTLIGDHYFGHVAPHGICIVGQPGRCVTPPDANLDAFHRAGPLPGFGGRRTGVVTFGDHSETGIGAEAATRHYDKVGYGVADVRVGRDAYGIWFSGKIRPGTSEADRYRLAGSDVSGHWEVDRHGRMMLVGLPAVNVGGFPKGRLTAAEVSAVAASAALDCGECADADADNPTTEADAETESAPEDAEGEVTETDAATPEATETGNTETPEADTDAADPIAALAAQVAALTEVVGEMYADHLRNAGGNTE